MNNIINPTQPELPKYEDYIQEIEDIFSTGILTNNGPKLRKFRELLKERLNCNSLELFVNGHMALTLGIASMKLPEGGEVLTSPFTFVSTTNAIIQNGLVPVFCDVGEDYNISIESIERSITNKTCAIITPHIFGIPCDVESIDKIAKKHNLKVIYDAAQAFGTRVNGKDVAEYGDGTMFSLHAIKVFNSIEGGVFVYKDEQLTRCLTELKNFGICIEDKMDSEYVGVNAKMDEFRAAMGIVNLKNVDDVIAKRKKLADHYIERLSNIEGVSTFSYKPSVNYNYAYFPVRVNKEKYGLSRDQLFEELKKKGIGSRKLYSRLTCDYKAFQDKKFRKDVTQALKLSEEALDLPIYSGLDFGDIDRIVGAIKDVKRS